MTRFDLVTKNYAKSMKNMNFFLKNEICNKGDSVTMACAGMGKNPRVQEVVINASPSEPKKSTCGRQKKNEDIFFDAKKEGDEKNKPSPQKV